MLIEGVQIDDDAELLCLDNYVDESLDKIIKLQEELMGK